jgi:hypothetical protein
MKKKLEEIYNHIFFNFKNILKQDFIPEQKQSFLLFENFNNLLELFSISKIVSHILFTSFVAHQILCYKGRMQVV